MQAEAERIGRSKFTSAGDHLKVVKLYKDYVGKLASLLQSTLAVASRQHVVVELPPLPSVKLEPASTPLLADGQVVLVRDRKGGSRAGEVHGTRVAFLFADTQIAEEVFLGRRVFLFFFGFGRIGRRHLEFARLHVRAPVGLSARPRSTA